MSKILKDGSKVKLKKEFYHNYPSEYWNQIFKIRFIKMLHEKYPSGRYVELIRLTDFKDMPRCVMIYEIEAV
jgi:hypothetical protein